MFKYKNNFYISFLNEKNYVEIFDISEKTIKKENIKIDLNEKLNYIKYKIFNEGFCIIIYKTEINVIKNIFLDKQNILNYKNSFYKESNVKIKFYQINNETFIILNGRLIYILNIFEKKIILNTFRINNIIFAEKLLTFEKLKKDKFTGENFELTCQVSYNKDDKYHFAIQKLILPNFENEVIIDFNIIYIEEEILNTYLNKGIIFIKNEKLYFKNLMNIDNNEFELKEISKKEFNIDKIFIINKNIIIFANNNEIYNYQIIEKDNKIEIKFLSNFNFNKENNFFVKYKIFYQENLNNFLVYLFEFSGKIYLISIKNDFKSFTFNLIKDINLYEYINNFYIENKEIDENYIKILKKKNSILNDIFFFYNKIIVGVKKDKKYLYVNTISKNKKLLIIFIYNEKNLIFKLNFNLVEMILEDFINLEFDDSNFFIYIIYDYYEKKYKLNLLNLNNKINENKIILNYPYHNIEYLKELNKLILISNFGKIKFLNTDNNGSIENNIEFDFNFNLTDSDKIKNDINDKDILNLFILNSEQNYLTNYKFIKKYFFYNFEENEIFIFNILLIQFNIGIVAFVIMINKITNEEKIFLNKLIKANNSIKNLNNININNINYDYFFNELIINNE